MNINMKSSNYTTTVQIVLYTNTTQRYNESNKLRIFLEKGGFEYKEIDCSSKNTKNNDTWSILTKRFGDNITLPGMLLDDCYWVPYDAHDFQERFNEFFFDKLLRFGTTDNNNTTKHKNSPKKKKGLLFKKKKERRNSFDITVTNYNMKQKGIIENEWSLNSSIIWPEKSTWDSMEAIMNLSNTMDNIYGGINSSSQVAENIIEHTSFQDFQEAVCELQVIAFPKEKHKLFCFSLNLHNLIMKHALILSTNDNNNNWTWPTSLSDMEYFIHKVGYTINGDFVSLYDLRMVLFGQRTNMDHLNNNDVFGSNNNHCREDNEPKLISSMESITSSKNKKKFDLFSTLKICQNSSIAAVAAGGATFDNESSCVDYYSDIMIKSDIRVIMSMVWGTKTTPFVSTITLKDMKASLQKAATRYCDQYVSVEQDEVSLPSLFSWFRYDFGRSPDQFLQRTGSFLSHELKRKIRNGINQKLLIYHDVILRSEWGFFPIHDEDEKLSSPFRYKNNTIAQSKAEFRGFFPIHEEDHESSSFSSCPKKKSNARPADIEIGGFPYQPADLCRKESGNSQISIGSGSLAVFRRWMNTKRPNNTTTTVGRHEPSVGDIVLDSPRSPHASEQQIVGIDLDRTNSTDYDDESGDATFLLECDNKDLHLCRDVSALTFGSDFDIAVSGRRIFGANSSRSPSPRNDP